jgi:tRNA nucleotidyltransferase/poly(A) polymerase
MSDLTRKVSVVTPKHVKSILTAINQVADQKGVDVWLVGGSVRDLLLGSLSGFADMDFIVDGEVSSEFAIDIANRLSGVVTAIPKFYVVTIILNDGISLDFVSARSEKYLTPGSQPLVERASVQEDIFRRDFTINSLAINLKNFSFDFLDRDCSNLQDYILDLYGGVQDLNLKTLRTLHADSFNDDPMRILRGIRYLVRFQLQFAPEVSDQILNCLKNSYIKNVSYVRRANEFQKLFKESDYLIALNIFNNLDLSHDFFDVNRDNLQKILNKLTDLDASIRNLALCTSLREDRGKIYSAFMRALSDVASGDLLFNLGKSKAFKKAHNQLKLIDFQQFIKTPQDQINTDLFEGVVYYFLTDRLTQEELNNFLITAKKSSKSQIF